MNADVWTIPRSVVIGKTLQKKNLSNALLAITENGMASLKEHSCQKGCLLQMEYPYFVIDSHTDGLNHEAHEEQEVILC
jgi:hypothetical protein